MLASTDPLGSPARSAPQTVLLTGGSGVVGQALLARLRDVDVVCLVHRSPIGYTHATSVPADITQHRLGLSPLAYERLAEQVGAVVHCAAVTDFGRSDSTIETTNVTGTQRMIEFAADAGAVLYHVSTAFVHTVAGGERGRTAARYASSKLAGEALVRSGSAPAVILRPSVVIGHSLSGEIAAFQGLHRVADGIFSGLVPLIPFDASWPIDFVPSDVVADSIARVVESGVTEGDYWITAGERSLRLDEAVGVCLDLADELGVAVNPPRFVPPEMFDRLIGPVFLDALPPKIARTVTGMLEFFATYLESGETKPSSLEQLAGLGVRELPDQRTSLRRSLAYWARARGYLQVSEEVA